MTPLVPVSVLRLALGLSQVPDQTAVDAIEREARVEGVPVSLAIGVCTVESRLGTRGRILCGCYVCRRDEDGRLIRDERGRPRIDTSIDAQARCVAVSLRHHRARCRAWAPALRHYNLGGNCPLNDPRGYVSRAIRFQRAVARLFRESLLTD